jgi:hypothetical protein
VETTGFDAYIISTSIKIPSLDMQWLWYNWPPLGHPIQDNAIDVHGITEKTLADNDAINWTEVLTIQII